MNGFHRSGNHLARRFLPYGLGSICRNQSAVTVRLGAGLTSAKLTLFFRSSTTGRTTNSKYLFGAEFPLHSKKIMP